MGFQSTVSYDEFGIPIKSETEEVSVDEFGIPIKKKEQTEPTQQVQAQEVQTQPVQQAPTQDAPLQGLGGVSEEPTPSPSVGQGVLRDVDQTQPTGEEFISQVSEGVLETQPIEETSQDGVSADVAEETDSDFFDIIGELEGFQRKLAQEGKISREAGISWKYMPNITDPAAKKEYNAIIDRYMEKYPDEVAGDDVWEVIKSRRKELEVPQYEEITPDGVSADVAEEPEWLIDLLGRDANKYESVDETLNQIESEKKDLDELESLGFETQAQIDSYNKRVNRLNSNIEGARAQIFENDRYQAGQDEINRISSLLESPKPSKSPLDSYDELEREALDIAGIDAPTQLEVRQKEQQRVQKQSASNNTLFGIDEPNEFLDDYTALPPPDSVKTDDDLKLYFSAQVGELQRRVNQALSDPEAYGFPKRIMSANEEDIQNLTNELYRQAQTEKTLGGFGSTGLGPVGVTQPLPLESQGEDFINLDESFFRKRTKSAIANYQANFNNVKYDTLLNAMYRDFVDAGYDEKQIKGGIFGELSNEEKWGDDEKILYDLNNELKSARDQLASSSPQSSKYQSIQQNYNDLLLKAEDARKELGSDREAFYDMRTGERVDKLDSPHVMDLTMQIQDEMEKLSFEENIEDVYIRAGLEDNEHKFYGRNTRYDFDLRLFGPSASFALDYLVSKGYKPSNKEQLGPEGGLKTQVIGFENVSLDDISNWFVRSALDRHGNEKLSEEAERWHDRNVELMSRRISARNMSLLNIDPGQVKKEQATHPIWGYDLYPTRMLEVLGETVLPKGMTEEIGMSDVKFVDIAMSQLESHGIELTEDQKENAKRSISLEVQEGVASFIPVIAELAVANKAVGAFKVVSGFKKIVDGWKAGDKFHRGLAIAAEASIEEVTMQAVGMKPGAGATFNILGNRFRKWGLDKFPLRFKGELARLNKIGDSVWSNALTGTITMEAAATMEAAIDDFAGGETMQNYLEENYSHLSEIGKRQIVNALVFNIIGARGLIGKGKSGLRIRRMEEARDELQKNGETAEADVLTGYIKEYYSGKTGKTENASYNDIREAVFDNLKNGTESTLIVESMDKVPEQFRDRVEEVTAVEGEVDVTFLGIPTGKKKKVEGKTTYRYKVSGEEMADVFFDAKGKKTETEFEQEFDRAQKTEEPTEGKEEPATETVPAEKKPTYEEPEVFTSPKEAEYAEVNRNDGKGDVKLTREEYEMEMAKKFAETQPTPKEPSAKERLALGEGKAEPKEAATVELKEGEIDITTVFKTPVEKNNEQAVAASNEFKDKAGEYDEGVNDPKFKEENTTVEEISVDDIIPTQERLFEENLKSPSEGEPLVMKVGDKYYVEDGHHRIGNGINADNQNVSVRVYESDKAKQDAIQEPSTEEAVVEEAAPTEVATEEVAERINYDEEISELLQRKGRLERRQAKVRNNKDFEELESEINAIDTKIGEIDKLKELKELEKEAAPSSLKDVEENPSKYGYHGGNLGGKSDYLATSFRGEQPFTGYYFFSNKKKALNLGNRATLENDARAVDFSKYNLLKPTTNGYWVLKGGVKRIWNNLLKGREIDSEIEKIEHFIPELGKKLRDNKESIDGWLDEWQAIKDKNFATRDYAKSKTERFETFLLKKLGYEGVDVRGLKEKDGDGSPDKVAEGSVIFDLKEGTVVDITPKPKDVPKIEPLTKEEAKSEEKVEEFVEKNLSNEKKNEEADKEIESKSEEELKEDVPDVLESISEAERGKLDREAKNKRKSTVDYVIDYLKGKIKNVRQSIKNILDKIKSNYRKAIITTAVIASVVKGSDVKIGGTSLRDVFKDVTELVVTEGKSQGENLALDLAVENPEAFKSISESYGENKYLDAIAAKAGLGKVEVFEVEKVEVSEVTPKDTVNVEALRKIIKKNDGKLNQKVEIKPGVTFISYRNTFLAEEGQEYVIIGRRDEREAAGNKDIEGVQYVAHHTLDDQMVGNERGGNSGFHNASMKMDGYVPYTLKRQVNKETGEVREIITYKKYSEIADTSKGIGEILSTDQKIGSPLRQFKFGDIDWNAKPKWTSNKEREKKGYSGSRVMKTSVELLLKPGKKNPYRTGGLPEKDSYGNYMNPRGTHILYLGGNNKGSLGEAYKGAIGKYNGGSFVYIFDYKGKTIVREVGSSVSQLKEEGDAIIKQFGVNPNDLTLGYHDVGSVSAKLGAENGKLGEKQFGVVNKTNPYAGGGLAIPIENKIPRDEPGDAPIGLMSLPLLFGGVKRKRKPLEDTDADKVVTEWMGDVQKIYDAQKTKNKEEARNQAAVNLALSGKLDNLAPDQVSKILDSIKKETEVMGKKWSVSTLSELEGLTIKEQFKQGFEEYVAAMKQKESDKIQKAKETAQAKIDAVKERTAKAVEKIKAKKEAEKIEYKDKIEKLKKESKADKEARKLFEAIVNDIAKDAGLSQISRKKASELLKSSRDVNAENIERLLEKAVRVIEYEYKRNIVKESDKKIKDFKTNIEKNEFGTLTQSAKELAGITTEDIPIGLLPRFVDVMDGVSKKSPSAKDLEELAKFMSEFKNELDQQITDVQYFADVLNDFKTQEETEKIDDYLKENGFSESQIEFFKKNRKAINAAYKSFYIEEGKDLTAQEKAQKIAEQILEARKVFNKMKADGEAKVSLNKFKGKVQQEVNIAEFFNNIKASDINYLSRTEANKLPVVFENLNRGMVTNTTDKIMNKIIGGRTLDSFEKLDPKSPIKRAETIDGIFKSFSSNSKEIKALGLKTDPASLQSAKKAFDKIKEKVLDYSDEVFKDLKGKPLYEQVGKIMRPIVNVNIKMAKIFDELNNLERKMNGSPLYNTVLMDMYFRSREFDLNPDNKRAMNPIEYIEATLESGDLLASQREVIEDIKNTYFRKKQGDKKSKPNTKEMLNEIKKRKGGPLIEFMDKTLESYQPIVQFISEVKESSPVDWFKGYFTRSSLENGSKGIEDLLSDVSNSVGRPSLKAGAAQSRKPGKHALNFNAIDNFKNSIASIELQYNAGQAISEVNAFISEAKRSGNMDAKIFAETLKKVVDAYVKNTLSQEYKDSKILGSRLTAQFFDSAGKKIKTATLAGALKVIKDSTAQTGKILIDEDARNALFKLVSLRTESKIPSTQEILDTLKSLHAARSGVLSAEMRKNKSYTLDALRKGTATSTEKALYSLSKLKGVELASALDKFLMDISTGLIKSPDLMGTVQLVVGGSAIKFKEITGQELDFNKLVSDPEYRAKYKEELEAAVSYGDQITTRIGGPGTVSQKPISEISEKNKLKIMDRFVRAFPTFESQQIQSAISTLIPPASKFTGRERGAEFENKRKAAQGLLASIYGLVGYASIGIVLNELANYAIMFLLGYEDDYELFQDFDSEAASTRVVSDVAWTSMFGKYGVAKTLLLQSAIAGGVRLAGEFAENEEDKELANKIADSMFYSTINKKTTVQKLAKSSGPEGKLVGATAELIYDTSADIVKGLNEESGKPKPYKSETKLLENPRFVQNLYTLSQGVLSQGPAQEVGKLVRTGTYEQDLSRKMNEAFGGRPSDESRSKLDYTENKILRLRKRTGDRYLIPSMVSLTKNITKNGVKVKFKLNQATVYELQREKAKFIKGEAEKLFKTNTYRNANDSEKSKLLKEIYGDWNSSNSEFIEKFYLSKGKVVR